MDPLFPTAAAALFLFYYYYSYFYLPSGDFNTASAGSSKGSNIEQIHRERPWFFLEKKKKNTLIPIQVEHWFFSPSIWRSYERRKAWISVLLVGSSRLLVFFAGVWGQFLLTFFSAYLICFSDVLSGIDSSPPPPFSSADAEAELSTIRSHSSDGFFKQLPYSAPHRPHWLIGLCRLCLAFVRHETSFFFSDTCSASLPLSCVSSTDLPV